MTLALVFCAPWLISCRGTPEPAPVRGLGPVLSQAMASFVKDLESEGVPAQSHFALFLPEGTVNKRHLVKFRRALEGALREAETEVSFHYQSSAERVFLLSEVRPEGWDVASPGKGAARLLASEYRNGSHEGWVAFHTYWSQFNRLAVGDRSWIDRLPDSVRSDLGHPLRYVVRAAVQLESNPNVTEYNHRLAVQFIEVGSERTVLARSYPLQLTYSLP